MYNDVKISLCVIARNEATRIGRCLDSALSIVDEVIVIDDESEDNTAAVALSRGLKVQVYKSGVTERPHLFDKLKNVAFEKASGDIIVSLDCDEILDYDIPHLMPTLVEKLMSGEHDSIMFMRRSYIDGILVNPFHVDYIMRMWRKSDKIYSSMQLHRGIVGYESPLYANLLIWHHKTAAMQQEDNETYASLGMTFDEAGQAIVPQIENDRGDDL